MKVPKIIDELLDHGIEISITKNDGDIIYVVSGFYKSEKVTLVADGESLICTDRYGYEERIETLEDLANLNARWLRITRKRSGRDVDPDTAWLTVLTRFGLAGGDGANIKDKEVAT